MADKISFDQIPGDHIEKLTPPTYNNLLKIAVDYSDALILAAEDIPEELQEYVAEADKPVLPFVSIQEFEEAYANFYQAEVLKEE